jgi:hypothetical protein
VLGLMGRRPGVVLLVITGLNLFNVISTLRPTGMFI